MLRLNSEPQPFVKMSENGSDLSKRAAAVLARVIWPGKAGETASPEPLNPEAQRQFDLGRDVYRNVCQACHQPDGRGQEKIAPSLIGSVMALAPAEIPIRILLNGKEGSTGLMPPIGASLTDEQLASVLTYIRREWGQSGSPVDVGTVGRTRALTKDRTRPWTDDELKRLTLDGRGGH